MKHVFRGSVQNRACLFLDRDGVINERLEGGYVTDWNHFVFRPDSVSAMRLASREIPLVIVTNQRCVARGIASAEDVERVMERMCDEIRVHDIDIAAWYACPHDIIDGCECRKPRPGMLLEAAADLDINIASSFIIGDSPSDVAAGEAAGCKMSLLSDPSDRSSLLRAVKTIMEVLPC